MKSRWSRMGAEPAHAPVEMRFVDMFMTALGSLIFMVLLLVFLLPKTAQPSVSEAEGLRKKVEESERRRRDLEQQMQNMKEVDKHVVKRWMSVLLLRSNCPDIQPIMYVRWEGFVSNFATGQDRSSMAEFDASDPKMHGLMGRRYLFLGPSSLPKLDGTAPTKLLDRTGVSAISYFTVSNAPGGWSIYVGLTDPRALKGKECTVHPIIVGWSGKAVETTLTLSLAQPFAWVRRVRIENEGEFKSPEPADDATFLTELAAFSAAQSQKLCEKKSICDTIDAHWAMLKPAERQLAMSGIEWQRRTGLAAVGYASNSEMSQPECEAGCLVDQKCVAIEYHRDKPRYCGFHDRLVSTAVGNFDVGIKFVRESPVVWKRDHLVEGGVALAERRDVSREDCAKLCSEDQKCVTVEYTKPTRSCKTLRDLPKIVASSLGSHTAIDVGIRVRGSGAPWFAKQANMDLVGVNLRVLEATTEADCEGTCTKEAKCHGVSYNKWTRSCQLKATLTGLRLDPKFTSSVRFDVKAPPALTLPMIMEIHSNKSFTWHGQKASRADSFAECSKRCEAQGTCVAVTYFKKTMLCRLMESVGELANDNNADSAIKRQELEY